MSKGTILLIDDEKDLIELVRYNLEREGFDVVAAANGAEGLEIAKRHKPDLIVLDLMMPGMDGLEVCQRLRTNADIGRVPIVMLTAKADVPDRVVGLEVGADDYVVKPFSPRELVARVRAVLRRAASGAPPTKVVRRGELTIDAERHEVIYAGKPVAGLTAMEFRVLLLLASRAGLVFSRDEILQAITDGESNALDRTVDVHVTAIRRKVGDPTLIETVRGFGYKLRG